MQLPFAHTFALTALCVSLQVQAATKEKDLPDPAFDIDPAEAAQNQHYGQPARPQFHYTPIQGHIGDATGLFYYQGEYHLFYMSDKWERRRNRHKCWGHAVSRDLLHWQELPSVLDPVIDHKPGSGSGIVDFNNTLHFQTGAEKTVAIFYTDYATGSCLAYSNDAGRTWTRDPGNPVLAGTREIRDPKVFWYEPTKEWRMVRYEDKDFVFHGSKDLRHWRELSRVGGFYECPDFFELPVQGGTDKPRWVLTGADGSYEIGTYDGTTFTPETEMHHNELAGAGSYYAPQTWSTPGDGGATITQMAFLHHPKASHLTWHNQMAFPVTLTVRHMPDGFRLYREPIAEIASLREEPRTWQNLTVKAGDNPLADVHGDVLEIRAEIDLGSATAVTLGLRGQTLRWEADGKLKAMGTKTTLPLIDHHAVLQVLVDRSSLELFVDHGRASVSKCVFFDPANQSFSLTGEGGDIRVISMTVNKLKSVWPSLGSR